MYRRGSTPRAASLCVHLLFGGIGAEEEEEDQTVCVDFFSSPTTLQLLSPKVPFLVCAAFVRLLHGLLRDGLG